jgi:hypothetical protein
VTTAVLERTALATQSITQAYAYAFDPTPEQANLLRSHIGARASATTRCSVS